MKNFFGLVVFGSALALAGCGGDSDSSGNYTSSFKKILPNGNEYSCPTQVASDACNTDATCQVAKCELTKEVVTPAPETGGECDVEGNTVYGQLGKTCTVTLEKLNGGSETELSCSSSGVLTLGNGLTVNSGSFNLNDYLLTCNR